MDLHVMVKKLQLPEGFGAPKELKHDDLVARPLSRADLKADLDGVNSSIEIIQKTRGGSWPSEALSAEFDFLDLAWHEREFRESTSFAYVVTDIAGTYIGCFYLYPMGHRTELTDDTIKYDVDASWWVTQAAYESGLYERLYQALQFWLGKEFPFERVFYSNQLIPTAEETKQ
jgi:hypothetical protein